MLIAYLILIALFVSFPLVKVGTNREYISQTNTAAIKGLFVILVFFCHYGGYVEFTSTLDLAFKWINNKIGQLCVVMFLFYSGYGIWYSYINKANYIRTFMKRRFLPVWLSFALCVLFFWLENAFLGIEYSFIDILFAFTGWTSIGNSNWYMFVTFALYIIFFLCFRMFNENSNKVRGLIIYTMLCCVLVIFLFFTKESWWYNTLLCFPAGMWFAVVKSKIDEFAFENNTNYIKLFVLSFILLVATCLLQQWHSVFFVPLAIQFSIFVVVVTMKFTFNSKLLSFCGEHVFSIYILQRLFFNLGQHYGLHQEPYLFFGVCLIGTIVLAIIYDYIFAKYKVRLIK